MWATRMFLLWCHIKGMMGIGSFLCLEDRNVEVDMAMKWPPWEQEEKQPTERGKEL